MSRLLSAADYQRELGALRGMIAEEERITEQYGPEPAAEIALASMRDRYSRLTAELESLGKSRVERHELAVVFDGRPVHEHSVDATFLGEALTRLQRVLEAMVASASGLKSRMASLPKQIQKKAGLRVSATFAGSFGVALETQEQEPSLFEDPSSIGHSISAFLKLVHGVESSEELLDAMEPLNARARTRYMELLQHLAENGADMRVEWPTGTAVSSASLRASQAKKLKERLSRVSEAESIKSYRGTLDGALKNRAIFEFKTEDGEVYTGRLGPGVLDQLSSFHYEEPCIATITTRIVFDEATGTQRVFHRLERLQSLEQQLGLAGDK